MKPEGSLLLLPYLRNYLLTYSKEQSPSSEANQFSASQEIPQFLWKPKVYYVTYLRNYLLTYLL